MIPFWLHVLSISALLVGFVCALIIAIDITRHPQHMWHHERGVAGDRAVTPARSRCGAISPMAGWPRTADEAGDGQGESRRARSYAFRRDGRRRRGPLRLRLHARRHHRRMAGVHRAGDRGVVRLPVDLCRQDVRGRGSSISSSPSRSASCSSISPSRRCAGFGFWDGIVAAVKADTLSLTAWQVGMYGFMAIAQFAYFRPLLGKPIEVNTPEFWFTMQIAMLCGFVTAYPVNWWLIEAGHQGRDVSEASIPFSATLRRPCCFEGPGVSPLPLFPSPALGNGAPGERQGFARPLWARLRVPARAPCEGARPPELIAGCALPALHRQARAFTQDLTTARIVGAPALIRAAGSPRRRQPAA